MGKYAPNIPFFLLLYIMPFSDPALNILAMSILAR